MALTAVEFLYPIRSASQRELVSAALYFFKHHGDADILSPADIKAAPVKAGIRKARGMNVTRALNEAIPNVNRVGPRGAWEITQTGEEHVRKILALPDPNAAPHAVHEVSALQQLAESQSNEQARGYIEEAIKCLRADALRAAVVFLWAGAIRSLHDIAFAMEQGQVDLAIKKHDPKARDVKKLDDFAYIKDKTLLLACGELGLLDKGERGVMEESLNLRNRCGHPTSYKPRVAKVSAFIEDVVGIVFS